MTGKLAKIKSVSNFPAQSALFILSVPVPSTVEVVEGIRVFNFFNLFVHFVPFRSYISLRNLFTPLEMYLLFF